MRDGCDGVPRFEDLAEATGVPVSPEGATMLATRYAFAARLAQGRDVLEVACGSGQGLGLLGQAARRVVAGDLSRFLLRLARAHYQRRVPLVAMSAEALPFADCSFDLVCCLEASYYLPRWQMALAEMVRVLRAAGVLAFVNANPERPDFIRSPRSVHYHTADEFRSALEEVGLRVEVEGAFPVGRNGGPVTKRLSALARRLLVATGLVPKTLRGRARLKRVLLRPMPRVPAELEEPLGRVESRVEVPRGPASGFKVIYVTARKPA